MKMKLFISKLKKLDILVNNAGTNIPESFLNVKKSSLETLLNVNTKAVFNVAQLCANQIIKLKRKSGSIINISSIFGIVAGKKRTVYSMTKFGVEGLTKGMALDLAKYNIRVNSVCPNIVLTPRTKKYFDDKKYNKYVKINTPINKVVTISDVATSITFLFHGIGKSGGWVEKAQIVSIHKNIRETYSLGQHLFWMCSNDPRKPFWEGSCLVCCIFCWQLIITVNF